MKAMIMAAGIGSRLMPLSTNIPKPMVPVANLPVMEHAVLLLKKYGITDIIANLHYLPDLITNHFANGEAYGVNLLYSKERDLLGTAGGVKNNEWFLDETFVILSGDGLTDINLADMLEFHKKKGALVSIALKQVDEVEKFGVAVLDKNQQITAFQEKPRQKEALSNLANTGIYILEPEAFQHIPKETFYDFGKDLFPFLVQKGAGIFGYEMSGYWCDIGSLEAYRQANQEFLSGNINTPLDSFMTHQKNLWCGRDVEVHSSAKITGKVVVGDRTIIGPSVEIIGDVVIGSDCIIGESTIINRAILWDGVIVGNSVVLNECVVGKETFLGKEVILEQGAVLGDRCIIEDYAKVPSQRKIETGRTIQKYSVAG